MEPRLSGLQRRILAVTTSIEPRFVLTGGGALAGVYLGHRETRDLDLFWRDLREVGAQLAAVEASLVAAGLTVTRLRHEPAFAQLRVSDGAETTVVDLVADPAPTLEAPREIPIDGAPILVDSPHEILVNKLSALLGRLELRDLVDVRALLDGGPRVPRSSARLLRGCAERRQE